MLNYSNKELSIIVSGDIKGKQDAYVNHCITDSRSVIQTDKGVFFALHGPNHNGHKYVNHLINRGVKTFVIDEQIDDYPPANDLCFIKVANTLTALQDLAQHYRQSYTGSVLGITGSNGKTIVKEWLYQILSGRYNTEKSPKSYNSQIGVPLSILQISNTAQINIIEAGISKKEEMERLEQIIKPHWGLITNIGDAHQENFDSLDHKTNEKFHLFKNCSKVYYCEDHEVIHRNWLRYNQDMRITAKTWSQTQHADLQILNTKTIDRKTRIQARYNQQVINLDIPFIDHASVENLIHIWLICLDLNMSNEEIQSAVSQLKPVSMRLEQKEGINNCSLINDYYNSDIQSIVNAIDLLFQQTMQNNKTILISDIIQSGESEYLMVNKIKEALNKKGFKRMIGIGPVLFKYHQHSPFLTECYPDTNSFLSTFTPADFNNEAILLKGARKFSFELINQLLEKKTHRTVLRISMQALRSNLNHYRSMLDQSTKMMVMVKAMAYGSSTHEVARFLAHQGVDYLGVAFIDEGIALREAGVTTPIMAMNPDFSQTQALITYKLEPEIFNLSGLKLMKRALIELNVKHYPIHLKFDTGMHRLGFLPDEADKLAQQLIDSPMRVASIFSHLAAAGNHNHDSFTHEQIDKLKTASQILTDILGYKPLMHILNTAGIESLPDARFDMVRLGIGLYGISYDTSQKLKTVLELTSYISQIHTINAEDTVGYDRNGKVLNGGKIGVIPVGYADGFDRRLGNGNWKVLVNGVPAPTVGNICMDMCMIDISNANAKEGDEVILIGGSQSIQEMSKKLDTIPYEIMTSISPRVKRVFLFE